MGDFTEEDYKAEFSKWSGPETKKEYLVEHAPSREREGELLAKEFHLMSTPSGKASKFKKLSRSDKANVLMGIFRLGFVADLRRGLTSELERWNHPGDTPIEQRRPFGARRKGLLMDFSQYYDLILDTFNTTSWLVIMQACYTEINLIVRAESSNPDENVIKSTRVYWVFMSTKSLLAAFEETFTKENVINGYPPFWSGRYYMDEYHRCVLRNPKVLKLMTTIAQAITGAEVMNVGKDPRFVNSYLRAVDKKIINERILYRKDKGLTRPPRIGLTDIEAYRPSVKGIAKFKQQKKEGKPLSDVPERK